MTNSLGRPGPAPAGAWRIPAATTLLLAILWAWLWQDDGARAARGPTRAVMAVKLDAMAHCQAFASRYVLERGSEGRAGFVRPHRQPDDIVDGRVVDRGGGTYEVRDSVTLVTPLSADRREYACTVHHRGGNVWRVETFQLSEE